MVGARGLAEYLRSVLSSMECFSLKGSYNFDYTFYYTIRTSIGL
ncbi:unnamed protein product [Fusarium graminearum]|nr:hypothetical protein FG05_35277 [Fusarium graminearum]CZS73219.1 unnamed protein product [Fusarium graminearum]